MSSSINKTNNFYFIFIHCVIPLFFGGILYILFRTTELRMFKWFSYINLDRIIYFLRGYVSEYKCLIPNWVYNSLPDGLWVYSFSSTLIICYNGENKNNYWLLFPLISGVIIEFLQGIKLFPGTFDYVDLIFTFSGLALSKTIINYKLNQNEKKVF
jgi:hypothetical protein